MIGRWLGGFALVCAVCGCGRTESGGDDAGSGGSVGSNGGSSNGGSSNGGSSNGGTSGEPDSDFVVDQIRQTAIDKMDVLFVVDNSISMADKQALLALAVPALVERLVNPDCVEMDDGRVVARAPADEGSCPEDFNLEFHPLDDIHIGVITSSLGGHGADFCSPNTPASWNETQNDRAHLIPTVRPDLNLPADDPAGFLAWDPASTTPDELKENFAEHVRAAGEVGCGYEATLEAWYRFLIDPSPPLEMLVVDNVAVPAQDANGIIVDTTLLAQREAFLRPDSVVAIVMLTDENDCSVVEGGIGWLTAAATVNGTRFTMPPATTTCDANPNDPCCRSCGQAVQVSGCAPLENDPNCDVARPDHEDALNLRCHNQKQRFGLDLLYPIDRYVAGLRDPLVYDTHRCSAGGDCPLATNPLFDPRGEGNPRDPSLIFLAGIVGVPWQDIATEASLSDPERLEYMTAPELTASGRWDMIIGDPEAENPAAAAALPQDPLMHEQSDPRTGTHPVTNEAIAPESSTDPQANSINGHETVNDDNGDLQYACIFPLAEPRDCSDSGIGACDCTEDSLAKNRPLCNPPGGGAAGLAQYYAKAYPGLRLLQTLRDFGDNSIVASICPKVVDPDALAGGDQSPAFGYNPAIAALVERTKEVLGGRCLPRSFDVDDDGRIACSIVEAVQTDRDCDAGAGRSDVNDEAAAAVARQMMAAGLCGGASSIECDEYSLCHIGQLAGDALEACQNQVDYRDVPGFCYIDASEDVGNEALLQGCPATEQRQLRFVGEDTPSSGSATFMVCDEADHD
ncbi:MAG TPA: hypothetical protein VI197_12330 [Polyangiaceae bacterium]